MTVPSARQVFGPARAGTLVDWFPTDQVGKPITALHAFWLRKAMLPSMPHGVQKALARRGLLLPPDHPYGRGDRWSDAALRMRRLLGMVPEHYWPHRTRVGTPAAPSDEQEYCPFCDDYVSAELIAWDLYDGAEDAPRTPCIECAMEGRP